MGVLFLLLLDAWPVAYGQQLVENLHTYDVLRYDVVATPGARGLDVDCTVTLTVKRPGPLRFLIGGGVTGLSVESAGRPVAARLGEGGFEKVVRAVAGDIAGLPSLLELAPDPPPARGATLQLRLRYRWRPAGPDWVYAGREAVQTHLGGFWLPMMADELFDAAVEVRLPKGLQAVAPGRLTGGGGTWRFESTYPLQVVPLVVGRFGVFRIPGKRQLRLLLPAGVDTDPQALLRDLAAVLGVLEDRFGPGPAPGFTLVVEPRPRPAPSYCGASFVVVHRGYLPGAIGRERWLAHLAHECAHAWWGHRVATPVIGRGGTWLREGLAQWAGIEAAGELLGDGVADRLYRACFRGYVGRLDLRRARGGSPVLFANEATLKDATYLDDPTVPYLRGALVLRRIAATAGATRFDTILRDFARQRAHVFSEYDDFVRAVGDEAGIAYYAATTRLPDLALKDVRTADGSATAKIECADPDWPGGEVVVRIDTDAGPAFVTVRVTNGEGRLEWRGAGTPSRIELDPERIHLDPIRSNSVWTR